MRNIKLLIEYDGTDFYGWQKQKSGRTVCGTIEEAIKKLVNEEVELIGCSRTDSGVHAKGFVASFKTNSKIPSEKFREAINQKLPDDVVILESEEVLKDFHPRYQAKGKTYCYTIVNRRTPKAIGRNYSCVVKEKLNVEKMQEACKLFVGTHDFKAFKSTGSSVKTTVRTIWDIKIEKNYDEIKIYVSGDGFLYNMVRIIVGTLLQVGEGKIKPEYINDIINEGDRNKAGKCMPAMGLSLEKVFY
ncbi:tRNA pseudouridine(38-40) synthase TruA [Clostridium sp. YIM B02551]|uniref:tRNA pseudouridine(38-40) synthase TruA n=1 Tax=Clostridium sp. YIM B02551 TaxID=2910679 RepID=UPI001EEAD5A9|nr:tRNA pseudouridine(38-40) synthase TruA [Clostridium sp. YIM B02551]